MRPLFRLFRTPFRTPTSLLRPTAPLQPLRFRLQSPLQRRLYSSPSPNPTPHLGSPPSQSLSARLKSLSKEYGWTAVGVYLGLSALDFPFCFLAVRMLGTDRIGFAEDKVVGWFWGAVGAVAPELAGDRQAQAEARAEQEREGQGEDACESLCRRIGREGL